MFSLWDAKGTKVCDFSSRLDLRAGSLVLNFSIWKHVVNLYTKTHRLRGNLKGSSKQDAHVFNNNPKDFYILINSFFP